VGGEALGREDGEELRPVQEEARVRLGQLAKSVERVVRALERGDPSPDLLEPRVHHSAEELLLGGGWLKKLPALQLDEKEGDLVELRRAAPRVRAGGARKAPVGGLELARNQAQERARVLRMLAKARRLGAPLPDDAVLGG